MRRMKKIIFGLILFFYIMLFTSCGNHDKVQDSGDGKRIIVVASGAVDFVIAGCLFVCSD